MIYLEFSPLVVTFVTDVTKCVFMEKEDEAFGAFRLKYKTIKELRQLKLSMENSERRELSNDEFIQKLIEIALNR